MNINDVAKREVLDFDQFKKKVHDETYKPFAAENQEGGEGKTGLHRIKREPASIGLAMLMQYLAQKKRESRFLDIMLMVTESTTLQMLVLL